MIFSFASLDKAEPFDHSWTDLYAQDVCAMKGSMVQGGLGPFGLLTLASKNLEEYTPVFFRVFKAQDKYKVLMCSDASRFVLSFLNTIKLTSHSVVRVLSLHNHYSLCHNMCP